MTLRLQRCLIAAALLWAGAGCGGDDFDPYNRVNTLRVLAIASDPVAPVDGESTTLTPFVYTRPGESELSYAWSWCPVPISTDDGGGCAISEGEVQELAGQTGLNIPPFDLGSEPTAKFDDTFGLLLNAGVCGKAMAGLPVFDCDQGFPVQIKLVVRSASEQVVATRRLRLRTERSVADTNPKLDGLAVVLDGEMHVLTETEDDQTPTLPRLKQTRLLAAASADSAEPYQGKDEHGQQVPMREHLILSWFVESGETSSERTSYVEGSLPLDDALQNLWKPARTKDYAPATARVFVVLRDDRDGVTWRSGVVRLAGEP